eukprot:5409541-Ditylum_brightwellii.AAC.1
MQELLAPHSVQTIPSLLAKKEQHSAFEAKPLKWLKKESPVAKPSVKKPSKAVAEKTELLL